MLFECCEWYDLCSDYGKHVFCVYCDGHYFVVIKESMCSVYTVMGTICSD